LEASKLGEGIDARINAILYNSIPLWLGMSVKKGEIILNKTSVAI